MRTISLALVGGLVAALAAAVSASAKPGATTAAATPSRPATSLPYRTGFRAVDDAAGDAQVDPNGLAAADITRFSISNNRAGFVVFAVTVNQNDLFPGDFVIIFVDLDRNQNTGCNGDEVLLQATGQAGQQELFEIYTCQNGQFRAVQAQTFSGAFDAPSRNVLFGISARVLGTNRFQALAMTLWEPDDVSSFRDFAPDGAAYLAYTVPQIPCNQFIRPEGEVSFTIWSTPRGRAFKYSRLGVERVPAGAAVRIRLGSAASASVRASSRGIAVSGRFRRFFVYPGAVVTVRVSAEGCTRTVRFRVRGSGRLGRI